MNILSLVLSVTAFICAFVPIFGIFFAVAFSIAAVIIAYVKTNKNKNKEGELIAVVLSIFAIIVCVIVNAIYIPSHFKKNAEAVDVYKDMVEYPLTVNEIYTTEFKIHVENIIYDEKMLGSIHLALGASHPSSDNGNKSGIHWDLVLIQREEYGGGEVYFDDVLIRKDGLFVLPELEHLNYKK